MPFSRKIIVAILVASTLAGSAHAERTVCRGDVCCRGASCHRFTHLDGSLSTWLKLGVAGAAICALAGCFGRIGGGDASPSTRNSDDQQRTGGAPGGYNMFDHVKPLPNYGVGE